MAPQGADPQAPSDLESNPDTGLDPAWYKIMRKVIIQGGDHLNLMERALTKEQDIVDGLLDLPDPSVISSWSQISGSSLLMNPACSDNDLFHLHDDTGDNGDNPSCINECNPEQHPDHCH